MGTWARAIPAKNRDKTDRRQRRDFIFGGFVMVLLEQKANISTKLFWFQSLRRELGYFIDSFLSGFCLFGKDKPLQNSFSYSFS